MPNVLIRGGSWVGLMDNMRYDVISWCRFTMSLTQAPHTLWTPIAHLAQGEKTKLVALLASVVHLDFHRLNELIPVRTRSFGSNAFDRDEWIPIRSQSPSQNLSHKSTNTINEYSHNQHEMEWSQRETSWNRFKYFLQLSDPHSRADPDHRVLHCVGKICRSRSI